MTNHQEPAPAAAVEDDEIEAAAMATVGKALHGLQPATRLRVLDWAASKYVDVTLARFVTNNNGNDYRTPESTEGVASWLRRIWKAVTDD